MKILLPLFFVLVIIFVFAFGGCTKSDNASPSKTDTTVTTKTGTTKTGTTTTGTTSTAPTCNAKISDVESMQVFPADNSWNQDVSAAKVDPYSGQIIARIATSGLKADFGSGLWDNAPIGIPFVVVCGSQPKVKVTFRANANDGNYGSESDAGPYPIPANAPIEGNGVGDSHVIVVDKDNKVLYELYNASVSGGKWSASSGAIFDLTSDKFRPAG